VLEFDPKDSKRERKEDVYVIVRLVAWLFDNEFYFVLFF